MTDLVAIARAAGGEVRGRQAFIPGPGHSKRDRSLSIALGDRDQVLWHSFAGDTWETVGPYLAELGAWTGKRREPAEISAERAAAARVRELETEEKRAIARALWSESRPLADSLAETYLRGRGIACPPAAAALRFHPKAPFTPYHPDNRTWPTLVGAITDTSGAMIGAHLTFLKRDGSGKALIDPARKVIGSQRGGAIWLDESGPNVVVAEGIETALSAAARCGLPAVAAISAGNLATFVPPSCVSGALIAFDRDPHGVGLRDAKALQRRLEAHGANAVLMAPPASYGDWNEPDQEARE